MRGLARALAGLVLALGLPPGPGQAAPPVTSGEHDGFSRLAIEAPAGQEWRAQTGAGELRITFPGQTGSFDLARIFDLIPKTRITEVLSTETEAGLVLIVRLGCTCAVEVFATPSNTVVADIRDPEVAGEAPAESAGPAAPAPLPAAASEAGPEPGEPQPESLFLQPALALPLIPGAEPPAMTIAMAGAAVAEDHLPPGPAEVPAIPEAETLPAHDPVAAHDPAPENEPLPADQPLAADLSREVDQARESLMRQLLLSVDQGLIDFAPPGEGDAGGDAAPETHDDHAMPGAESDPVTAPDPAHEPPPEPEAEAAPAVPETQIAAGNVYARDRADRPGLQGPRQPECPDPALLDPRAWPAPEDFAAERARLSAGLTGEFDRPDPALVTGLTQLLLGSGFGAEARQLLREFGADLPFAAELAEIGALADGAEGPMPALSALGHCSEAAAFWALIAGGGASLPGDAVTGATTVFAGLPVLMRRLLAQRTGQALLDLGEGEAAERIFYLVTRAPGPPAADLALFAARLALFQGRADEAAAVLSDLVAGDSAWATLAALDLAELAVERGWEAPAGLADNIASRTGPLQGSETGRRLLVAEMYLRAGSRELGDALAILAEARQRNPEIRADHDAVLAELILAARPPAEDGAAYAAAILAFGGDLTLTGSGRAARLLAARNLRRIGLSDEALALLTPLAAQGDGDAALEAARAAIDQGEFAAAETWLGTSPRPEAEALRERILLAGGELAAGAPAGPSDAQAAFALGDWDRARQAGDEGLQALAAYMFRRANPGAPLPDSVTEPPGPAATDETPDEGAAYATAPGDDAPASAGAEATAGPEARSIAQLFAADEELPGEVTLAAAGALVTSTGQLLETMKTLLAEEPAPVVP